MNNQFAVLLYPAPEEAINPAYATIVAPFTSEAAAVAYAEGHKGDGMFEVFVMASPEMEAPTVPENPQQKITEIVNWLSANADNLSTAFGCPRADIYDITDALTNLEPEADEDEATVIEPGYI